MIIALDGTSPARLLLAAIRQSGMDMDAAGSFKDDETFLLGTGTLMYRITAGDPSRGNISLEPQNVAPPEGTCVQVFRVVDGAQITSSHPLAVLPPPKAQFKTRTQAGHQKWAGVPCVFRKFARYS